MHEYGRLSTGEKALAILLATGGLLMAVRSCGSSSPESPLLTPGKIAAACHDSPIEVESIDGTRLDSPPAVSYGRFLITAAKGDTAESLAARFFPDNTAGVESIQVANGLSGSGTAPIGAGKRVDVEISDFATRTLPKGTSLAAFAKAHTYPVATLECLDGIAPKATFSENRSLVVPEQAPTAPGFSAHVVRRGESYSSIAVALHAANNLVNSNGNTIPPTKLHPGVIVNYKPASNGSPAEIESQHSVLAQFVATYQPAAEAVQKKYGVPAAVTLAMAMHETGYGTSQLAVQGHNFFGIKAGSDWKGATIMVPTNEQVDAAGLAAVRKSGNFLSVTQLPNGMFNVREKATFRSYKSPTDSFMDFGNHLKTAGGGKDYADVFSHSKDSQAFLAALFDSKGAKYATDAKYVAEVGPLVEQVQILLEKPVSVPGSTTTLAPRTEHYTAAETNMITGTNCVIGSGPDRKPDTSFTNQQRLQIALNNVAAANVSAAGYKAFRIQDIHQQIEQEFPANFDSVGISQNGRVVNARETSDLSPQQIHDQVKYFILHFTATPDDVVSTFDGHAFAQSEYNGSLNGRGHDGANFFANNNHGNATVYWESDVFVNQVIGLNRQVMGIEMAGCDQAAIQPDTIEAALYTAATFLIDNGYIAKGKPITPVVNAVVKGHAEELVEGADHQDWPTAVADPFRAKLIGLLAELGYTR